MTSHNGPGNHQDQSASCKEIATRLAAARRDATPLAAFPGEPPANLDAAYAIQDTGISLASGDVAGWKVGKIPLHLEDDCGIDRLAGPIFRDTIQTVESGDTVDMAGFDGGFIAIEAEFVIVIARDAPADKTTWTTAESAQMIDRLCIGLELASSPLHNINDLGPAVVVADFGNNRGLLVGPTIEDWRTRPPETMVCTSHIDGTKVGDGGAFTLVGGFVRSAQFLLELNAHRGTPLRAGDVIATGQTTGIHDIQVGQTGTIDFGDDGVLECRIVKAEPGQL